jgi:hypothetical protein
MVKSMFAGLKTPISTRVPGLRLGLAAPFTGPVTAALRLTCPFQIVRRRIVVANG